MPILNYTTKVNTDKTVGEITTILVKHGASKIVYDYDGPLIIAVTFSIKINDNLVGFSLPCNYEGVLRAMQKDKKTPRSFCTQEQAIRVSWRIIKDWVAAQMAIVESGLAEVGEVFLPYAITPHGTTLYNHIKNGGGNNILSLNPNN